MRWYRGNEPFRPHTDRRVLLFQIFVSFFDQDFIKNNLTIIKEKSVSLPKRFNPRTAEPRLQDLWQEQGTFQLLPQYEGQVYAIDTVK